MRADNIVKGKDELRGIRVQSRGLYWIVGLFSFFANLLLLTGPIYMLQVYDRVLVSSSVETLVALSALMAFLYLLMGVLDFVRGRIMQRVGLRFQQALEKRVFQAMMRKAAVLPDQGHSGALQELGHIQRLISAPLVIALYDIPWTPIFFAAIFVFHPLLGIFAIGGAAALVLVTCANQFLSRRSQRKAQDLQHDAQLMADQMYREAETLRAMGMSEVACARWHRIQSQAQDCETLAVYVSGSCATLTKTLRLFLQSAMLGLAAWLVIAGQMTAGGMIAGSILLGRALQPVEAILTQWPLAQQGMHSWTSLAQLLGDVPPDPPRVALPDPQSRLAVQSITVVPPGDRIASIKSLSFKVEPGQAVGVIGPSGAGKSTLARALVGVWPLAGGQLRLGDAALDHYGPDVLGRHIGYLPQRVQLFDGTLAENIARLALVPDEAKVVEAAEAAGAHQLILRLPQGYNTPVRSGAVRLSGGQLQRIGLARALYDHPAVLVLDEPNANLDNDGSAALNHAIRQIKARGGAVIVMAHRPAAIQECDMILMLEGGMRMAFGPKQDVLAGMVKNATAIKTVTAAGMT